MSCSKPITTEPLLGGLDSRNHRGTGRPNDYELILNYDGSIEEGYQRVMGWRGYGSDFDCRVNQDLHDQMWVARQVVDITPTLEPLAPPQPVSPWLQWSVSITTNRLALRSGKVYLRVSFLSAFAVGTLYAQAETGPITESGTYTVNISLPGDAHDIKIIRAIGEIAGGMTQLESAGATGTGTIIETGDAECGSPLTYEHSEISLLKSITSVTKKRKLIAGTADALYVNDDLAGNWRIIADSLGDDCGGEGRDTSTSFKMVALGNIVLFVNGFDLVLYYRLDDLPAGAKQWSADYVLDLQALRITTANVIGKFDGFVLIGDVVADAQVQSSRIYWSDYNDPLSWVPGGESAAGFHDFGHGEIVLAIEPIGGVIRIYTSKAIYDGTVVNDSRIFAFEEIYRDEEGSFMMRYPNTLVNTGEAHYYLGADSVYSTTVFDRTPRRVEWMHVAAGVIFRGIKPVVADGIPEFTDFQAIDKKRCRLPVGGYDTVREAVWFSWPTTSEGQNDVSLVLWPRYRKASVVNRGFTAFCTHKPDHMITVRDLLDELHVCHASNSLLSKEGAPCDKERDFETPTYLYNSTGTTADPMDPDSAIGRMCGFCLDDLCKECDADIRFLMASTGGDVSIKEYAADCGAREYVIGRKLNPWPLTSTPCYADFGYTSVLQARLNRYGSTRDKLVTFMEFNVSTPGGQTLPVVLKAQIGVSDCPDTTRWSIPEQINACDSDPYPIPDEHTQGSRPTDSVKMPFYECGEYVTFRFFVDGLGGCHKISASTIMLSVVGE